MASVTVEQARLTGVADDDLAHVRTAWESIPETASEWSSWEDVDREVFRLEWGICESRLRNLARWAGEGLLTAGQMKRYRRLLDLVEQHRPTLERLFEEEPARKRKAA